MAITMPAPGAPGGGPETLGGVGARAGTVQAYGVLEFQERLLFLLPQLTTNGAASVEQVVTLPRTAVLDPGHYLVTVYAGRAQWTLAANVGQVRKQDANAVAGRTTFVVDFGVLRTVAAIGLLDAHKLSIIQVKPWTGIAFAPDPVYVGTVSGDPLSKDDAATGSINDLDTNAIAGLQSEIKTERLQIDLLGNVAIGDVQTLLAVQLPDVPSDLELRIDGGLPVWSAPGPVVAGAGGWSQPDATTGLLSQTVDLSAALTALLADPSASPTDTAQLHVVLSARVPGALTLEVPTSVLVLHAAQVAFEHGTRDVTFGEEGLQTVPLPLPSWAKHLVRLQLTAAAKLPPLRVLPPVGPDPLTVTRERVVKPFAELVLDGDHAAAAALPGSFGLAALTGVRVPLRPDASGAEARIMLLQNTGAAPGAAVDGGVSQPVTLDPPTSDADVWTTFTFPQPVKIDPAALPYVGVLVTRGKVTWALTASADGGQAWRGPPTGPLQELPTLGALAALRARVRIMGTAPADQPLPPLLLGFGTAATPVSPTQKGIAVQLAPPLLVDATVAGGPVLDVVARVAGTVTLSDALAIVSTA